MPNLLFIGPKFYNYHEVIKKGFECAGYEVDYFDDRIDANFLTKAIIRINKNFIKKRIERYFDSIINKAKEKQYEIVFVLYGQIFTREMIKKLKESLPKSRFIFYMYDPISSMPDRLDFSLEFDDCYSFDYDDCQKYSNFSLVPLFYSFKDNKNSKTEYDASFIGTMMPGKYSKVNEMIQKLKRNNFSVFEYKYLQAKIVWLFFKFSKKEFRKSKMKEFVYKRMDSKQAYEILQKSRYVIDCPKEGQSGLTMRTFEALSANRKLITTNKSIINYDIYNPQNIYIYEGSFDFENIFFKTEFSSLPNKVKDNYSIDAWVSKILKNVERKL